MDVTLSTYEIVPWRSSEYQTIEKVHEQIYPVGTHKLSLDNKQKKYITFANYNCNLVQVKLKSPDGTIYDPSEHKHFNYPNGYVISSNNHFTSICVEAKLKEHFGGILPECDFVKMYMVILFVVLYFARNL